jgi:hypothetical protein
MRQTQKIALTAIFAALHTTLSLFPGPVGFRSWIILITPLEGIILGPLLGFSSASIGYLLGWFIRPRAEPIIFGIGEPVGALTAGLIAQKRWPTALLLYTGMLLTFFAYPLTTTIPLWTLWDTYVAFTCIFIFAIISRTQITRKLPVSLGFSALIGTEADVLTRIFILIPLSGYQWWGIPAQLLPYIFVLGAFQTPIEAVISVAATIIIGVPLIKALQKSKMLSLENLEINFPILLLRNKQANSNDFAKLLYLKIMSYHSSPQTSERPFEACTRLFRKRNWHPKSSA